MKTAAHELSRLPVASSYRNGLVPRKNSSSRLDPPKPPQAALLREQARAVLVNAARAIHFANTASRSRRASGLGMVGEVATQAMEAGARIGAELAEPETRRNRAGRAMTCLADALIQVREEGEARERLEVAGLLLVGDSDPERCLLPLLRKRCERLIAATEAALTDWEEGR